MKWHACLLALLVGGSATPAHEPQQGASTLAVAGSPSPVAYRAEIEVTLKGVTRRGTLFATREGCVHIEMSDEQSWQWVYSVINPGQPASKGWDDRTRRNGPERRVWGQWGAQRVLTEVHAADACLKISRHVPLTR